MTDTEIRAQIEDAFNAGEPLDLIVGRFAERGIVLQVLRTNGWDLDGSGRLPRSKRTTVPRGLRGLPPAPAKTTSTTSRHRTAVPDRLTGAALPTEPPTPAEAMAEQAALDVPVGDPPAGERWLPPVDDPRLPKMTASVTVAPIELAREIRARVDEIAPRANPDGSVNASHVAMEQTLRERADLAGYFTELDGPGNFLPDGDADPVSDPSPSPDPVTAPEPPPEPAEPAAPWERHARMPCVVKPIMEPRTPIDPAPPRRRPPRPQPPLAQRGRQPAGLDLDDWLDTASRSPSPAVREAADRACRLHEQLHDALDDLVRAEHAHAREQA